MWRNKWFWPSLSLLCLLGFVSLRFFPLSHQAVDFNTEIRPILNEKCLSCHGGVKRRGGLSFLSREDAMSDTDSGLPAMIPRDAAGSEMMARIKHDDVEERMPLDAEPLSKEEINLLERWIEQGAKWEDHWAYVKPQINIPSLQENSPWIQNDIDRFVWAYLEEKDISPTQKADKQTLIRRVSLDLIGLAPSPEEVKTFVEDNSEGAFEKLVDRLLASPKYGERWTALWMDLGRYGDSQGYQKDKKRIIWPWREWVIQAFNKDMPFDQFTIEQLAGDLLDHPSDEQLMATAFHRNTMSNDEGGTDDEEFRVTAVIDRLNTTFEVWQGTTIGCVQCHSHPYDPFLHQEFYQLYAFFNNTSDTDKPSDYPTKEFYTALQKKEIEAIHQQIQALDKQTESSAEWDSLKEKLATIRPVKMPVMEELPADSSRASFIFERGNWLVHGKKVSPKVPNSLSDMPAAYSNDRLGLARWLVHPDNPLTARVIANRFWEQLFGRGLVGTLEDFGTQGDQPTYPKLLDWLAVKFATEYGWSIKQLLKEIVMSATYQQSSKVSPRLEQEDALNLWLARGPRVRLTAEQVRDQALAASGLLSDKMYGPSVMPPQPEGTWQVIRNVMRWQPSEGEDRFRRAIYTFWRRSSPYPSMITFDTPSREFCISRRIPTNTPLQALVTLNDSVYQEASQALAQRMWELGQHEVDLSLSLGYKLLMAKSPTPEKLDLLHNYYREVLPHYQAHPEDAEALLTMVEEPSAELAAMTMVANVILNLDEVVMKE